jgi:hypothetical protein
MRYLIPFYILGYAILAVFVETCSRPSESTEPAESDPLVLQHKLSHAIDSVDSAYIKQGCTFENGMHICPDPKPPGPP